MDTATVRPADRVRLWQEVSARRAEPLAIRRDSEPVEPFEALIVACPVRLVAPYAERMRSRTAEPLDGDEVLGWLVRHHLTPLFENGPPCPGVA